MKKIIFPVAACGLILIAAILLNPGDTFRRARGRDSRPASAGSITTGTTQKRTMATTEVARAAMEMLPLAEEFLRRIESLAPAGVLLPFGLPLADNEIRRAQFAGGASNRVCTFDLGGHSLFGCHAVNRQGKEWRGVNLFRRKGKDEFGIQRNIIQLTENPAANESQLRMLSDTNSYPARDRQEVAALAQRVLSALRPDVAAQYKLAQSWQEQAGAARLPFYTFTFARSGPPATDPGNLMRDEIVIGLKSTAAGLVLDSFEDNSIAFLGAPSP